MDLSGIELVFADEVNDQFVSCGGAAWASMDETRDQFWRIPTCHRDTPFIADLLNANGDIVADKPVSRETVEALLGRSVDDLIGGAS